MRNRTSSRPVRHLLCASLATVALLTLGCESILDGSAEGSADAATTADAGQGGRDVEGGSSDTSLGADVVELPPAEDPDPDATEPGDNSDCATGPVVTGVPTGWESAETVWPISGMVANGSGKGLWYVESASGTSTGGNLGIAADGSFEVTIPLFCGEQTVKLKFENADCATTWVTRVVRNRCEEPELRVTLGWDDLGRDWELHLIRPGGRINTESDCTWTTCINESLDWGVVGDSSDNPNKDIDDLDGYGPENIYLPSMEEGRYHVYVDHWGNGDPASQGELFIQLGNQTFRQKLGGLAPRHVWLAATIDWPAGTVAFSQDVLDCSDSWTNGCMLPIPE